MLFPIRYLLWAFGNLVRRMRRGPDYVTFLLEGEYSELPPPKASFIQKRLSGGGGKRPTSLKELAEQFRRVAGDKRVRGVVLHVRPLATPLAHLQTLRELIAEFRTAGKRVIAWSTHYTTSSYFVASAADQILLQPGGYIDALGFKQSYYFLADAFASVGLQADFVPISPFKSAADSLTRRNMSEEVRQMSNWLIDSAYEDYLSAIADARAHDLDGARLLVDQSPYTDQQASQAKAVDGLVGEEDLPSYLGGAKLVRWEKSRKGLIKPPRPARGKYIALVRIEGDIIDGRSQRLPFKPPGRIPLLTNDRAGDLSVVQDLRKAASDKRAAAVVVYVESGGGSAVSSEAMARAMEKVAKRKPVIASMGWVAASGGYWVTTPASWVVAQSGTLTGSIGVLIGKVVTTGMLEKLMLHREVLSRGENALLDSGTGVYSEEERKKMREGIERIYDQFLDRVSAARKTSREAVDAVAGGRVWTGRQAVGHGLIDETGGLDKAIKKAKQLVGLPDRARVREVRMKKEVLAPRADLAAAAEYLMSGASMIKRSRALAIMPIVLTGDGDF